MIKVIQCEDRLSRFDKRPLEMIGHSRGEGRVYFGTQVVRVEDEHANHKCQEYHDEEDHEFEDVLDSAAQWDLKGSEALIGRKDVSDARKTQHHGDGVETLRDELRVWGKPFVPGYKDRQKHSEHVLCVGLSVEKWEFVEISVLNYCNVKNPWPKVRFPLN